MSEGYHVEDEVQRRSYDGQLMRRLLGYVRPYRGLFILSALLLLLAALVGNVTPWLNMRAIDAEGRLFFGVRPRDNDMCTADKTPTALLDPVVRVASE